MQDDETRGPGPGWFPDPAGEAGYRWWDGSSWTNAVEGNSGRAAQPITTPRGERPSSAGVRTALVGGAVVFGFWFVLWLLALPLLVLSDADNGRFGHDLAFVWVPEVALGVAGLVLCVALASGTRGRTRVILLVWPGVMALVIITWSLVALPLNGG